jgi:hypothetical protein
MRCCPPPGSGVRSGYSRGWDRVGRCWLRSRERRSGTLCLSATGRLSAKTAARISFFPLVSKRFIWNAVLSNQHAARAAVRHGGKRVLSPATADRHREASGSSSLRSAPSAASQRWCRSSHATVDRSIAATATSGCASVSDSAPSHCPRIDRPFEPDRR